MQGKLSKGFGIIDELVRDPFFINKIKHIESIPGNEGKTVPVQRLKGSIDERLLRAFGEMGIKELYAHQFDAISAVLAGKDVAVSTPTSSGKTLVYNTSVANSLLGDPGTTALYVFPMKALARDQLKGLAGLAQQLDMGLTELAAVYDGDTPGHMRRAVRERGRGIIITNPDMLHLSILSNRDGWYKFLSGLRYVVLDEVHTYRGVFGSNVGNVIRRLWRILGAMNVRPQVICTSATMSQTGEFLRRLLDRDFEVFEESSAPSTAKHFTFINPMADEDRRDLSSSPGTTARNLLAKFVSAGIRTICFTQSRKQAELIAKWTREVLEPGLRSKVESYRAGYLAEDRRIIERRMASGELLGIVSTSALELGIDIGHLSSCILLGYPGTMVSTWQRAGRVGRTSGDSDAYISLIAGRDALDQYIVEHARELFGANWERAVIDPDNHHILEPHILSAAVEMPIRQDEVGSTALFPLTSILRLKGQRKLRTEAGTGLLVSDIKRAHRRVDMRNMGFSFTITGENGKILGDIDGSRVFHECHPGAIYLHRGESHVVERLDLLSHTVQTAPTGSPNHTHPMVEKEVKAVRPIEGRRYGSVKMLFGDIRLEEEVVGYYERTPGPAGRTVLEKTFDEPLPRQTLDTKGIWITLPLDLAKALADEFEGAPWETVFAPEPISITENFAGSLHGAEHNLISLLPMYAMCDRWDVGGLSTAMHPDTGLPSIFVYDGIEGGMGFARRGFETVAEWMTASLHSLRECSCREENGCPACIQSPKCGNDNRPLHRKGAMRILEHINREMEKNEEEEMSFETGPPIITGKGGDMKEITSAEEASEDTCVEAAKVRPSDVRIAGLLDKGILIFDLETERLAHEVGGWANKRDMGLSVAVTYDTAKSEYTTYYGKDVDRLFRDLYDAHLVVGFNLHNFDWEVLEGFPGFDRRRICALDIFNSVRETTGRKIALNNLGKKTVGMEKYGDGFKAVEWARKGHMEKLVEYCRRDVEITHSLFLHMLRHGRVSFEVPEFEHVIEVDVDLWDAIESIMS